MESFKSTYLSLCKDAHIEPNATLLASLQHKKDASSSAFHKLDLTGQALPVKQCAILGECFANDVVFTKLVLADAFVGDDGCIALANALKTNSTLEYLDLRGNSIRSDGAIALGQMLKTRNRDSSWQYDTRLLLEWNCIGIWESGVHAIGDALSINQTLEELDLRNNKIGPQGAVALAMGLKHNTHLRRLDLRWNNAGLIGGRAFVDCLKWNTALIELDLTGNELPEEIAIAIGTAIERNKDKHKHDLYTQAHTEQLTTTLQTLSLSHQEAIANLSTKLNQSDSQAVALSTKLAMASTEIQDSQDAFRALEAKYDRLLREKLDLEDLLTRERKADNLQISDLQKEVACERQKRMKLEDEQANAISEIKTRALELEASLREQEMKVEVLKRDKSLLLDELEKSKQREKTINSLWEEKMMHLDSQHHSKIMALQDLKDKEVADKVRKLQERIRHIESEKGQFEEEFDAYKSKMSMEKRQWSESLAQTEARIRKEEEVRRKDLEAQVGQLTRQHNGLAADLAARVGLHTQALKDHESQVQRLSDQKAHLSEQLAELKAKDIQISSQLSDLSQKYSEARKEAQKWQSDLANSQADVARLRDELGRERKERDGLENKSQTLLASKELLISRLKEELKRREEELDDRDEEHFLKMKELQLSINTLMSQKSRKHARVKSSTLEGPLSTSTY